MAINSKKKGAKGERELRDQLRKLFPGYHDTIIRAQQYCGTNGDSDVTGLPGLHIESKRTERLNLYDAVEQAVSDARDGNIPLVCHRRNRGDWLAIVRLEDLVKLAVVVHGLVYSEEK